jgi:IS605 OrfB family transposase
MYIEIADVTIYHVHIRQTPCGFEIEGLVQRPFSIILSRVFPVRSNNLWCTWLLGFSLMIRLASDIELRPTFASRKLIISQLTYFHHPVMPPRRHGGSNGKKEDAPEYFRKYEKKLARWQRIMSRRQYGGINWIKACLKVVRIHEKIVYARRDFLHNLSTKLIRENEVICLEDLKAKNMLLKNYKLAKSITDASCMACVFDDGTASLYSGRQIKAIRRYWQKVRANLKQKSRRWFEISHKERKQVDHLLHIATFHLISECRKRGTKEIAIGDLNGVRENIDSSDSLNQRLHHWPYRKIINMIK